MSYDYKHKVLWFRVYKAATRSIDHHLKSDCGKGQYIYASESGYKPKMFKDYFKFAFVRNPETRFVSAWKDKVLRQNYFKFSEIEHEKMKEIETFIAWVKKQNLRTCDEHLRTQCSLIDLKHLDFLGRFENFAEDFQKVADKIGLKSYESVHLNQTEKKKVISISDFAKSEIREMYREDFETFDY